jgi:hypothetical protein
MKVYIKFKIIMVTKQWLRLGKGNDGRSLHPYTFESKKRILHVRLG